MVISMRAMRFLAAVLFIAACLPALALGQSDQPQCQLSSLKVCAVHVLQDEAGIFASPVRTTPKDLLWIAPFGVATGVALDYDAHAMRSLGVDQQRQNTFETISNVGAFYVPLAASGVGYFIGGSRHNDLLRETAVLSAEAMVDVTILNQGLKYAIDRQDPQQGDYTGRFWPHGPKTWPDGQSMPSEHCMNVWAFAHVVAAQYNGPATKAIVYSLASTVSVSRILARQHFPSDVLVGSVLGYLVGGYVEHYRSREAGYLSLSSVSTPNGHGIQLSYNFAH
jgi:membrane-associated phospholipid phosphatase